MATPTKDQALALYEEVKKTRARVLEQNPNLITLIHSVATKGRELHYLFQNFKMDNIEIWDDPNNEPRRAAETALNYLEILTRYVVDYEMRVLQEGGCEDLAVAIERVDWDSTEEADRLYSSLIRRAATLTSLKRYYTPILKLINRAIKAINTFNQAGSNAASDKWPNKPLRQLGIVLASRVGLVDDSSVQDAGITDSERMEKAEHDPFYNAYYDAVQPRNL